MRNKVFDNTSSRLLISRSCPLSGKDAPIVDYKNLNPEKKYITEKGKFFQAELPKYQQKSKKNYLLPSKELVFLLYFHMSLIDDIKN